jgi:beta-alanine degradation protein BauB
MNTRRLAWLLVFLPLGTGAAIASNPQDEVVVDPGIAKVEFENELIRVVRVSYSGAHQRSQMHSHPARFIVTLTKNDLRMSLPNGTSTTSKRGAHEFSWSEPVTHSVENLADGPMQNIEIELKAAKGPAVQVKPDAANERGQGTESDPVPVEREPHHHLVFANQYVRVMEVIVPVGEMTLFHKHSLDNVAVLLSDTTLKNQAPGEDWTERPVTQGSVGFRAGTKTPYTHRIMNTGTTTFHVLDVQILP